MQYYYTDKAANFWSIIIRMIENNYISNYHVNDWLVLGSFAHNSCTNIKNHIQSFTNINKLIVYQLEPLVKEHWWNLEHLIKNLEGADEVWDYDLKNIEILRNYGIEAKFKPILYTPSLPKIPNCDNYDIDILFYGTFTPHREKFFRDITRGVVVYPGEESFFDNRLVWLYNHSGNDLDNFISKSKVVLNLNPHDQENRQQQTRIAHLLNNDKLVLSEKAEINYFGDSIIEFTDLDNFKHKVLDIFNNKRWENFNPINFKRPRNKIAIFFHIDQSTDWHLIFENQIWKTQLSSIYDRADYIHVGISGTEKLHIELMKINRVKYNSKLNFENETLYDLWNFAKSNPDYHIMYINTNINKSVDKNLNSDSIRSWRNYIEYFTINNWKYCIDMLKTHDCVGTEYINYNNNSYYLGNIWWANSNYLANLDTEFLFKNQNINDSQYWIFSKYPKFYNFYNSNKNLYIDLIDQSEYNNIIINV